MSTIDETADLHDRLVSLAASGRTLRQIASVLGMTRHETARAFAREGVPLPVEPGRGDGTYRTTVTDVMLFFRLWHGTDMSQAAIAKEMGVGIGAVKRAVKRYGLTPRPHHATGIAADEDDVAADEAAASYDSLRLAPSIERAAEEVRKRWTPEDEYNRRVTRRTPVTYAPDGW